MKRVRLDTWVCQLQPPRNPRLPQPCLFSRRSTRPQAIILCHRPRDPAGRRWASTEAVVVEGEEADAITQDETPRRRGRPPKDPSSKRSQKTAAKQLPKHERSIPSGPNKRIAKLSALHARLALPSLLPLQTLARCLIDRSADAHPDRNNTSLAILGQDLLAYYTSEHLIVNYPRLPLPIVFAAQYAFNGPEVLAAMRAEWGVELAAAPGHEVDRALLQFRRLVAGKSLADDGVSQVQDHLTQAQLANLGVTPTRTKRRGGSSRVMYDDEFGEERLDTMSSHGAPISTRAGTEEQTAKKAIDEDELEAREIERSQDDSSPTASGFKPAVPVSATMASATFIRALAGAIYMHAGDEAVKTFHKQHILSRHLKLHKLFHFSNPARDLNRLCFREGFEPPIARLLSETGRHSRTPVFVVGVFSGADKLGEAAGASLNEARVRAAAAALRSWYLYSPPVDSIMRPSSMENAATAPSKWLPQLIDPGEIVT